MIPKVIHYCWLSGDPYPEKIQDCMASWRKVMPDYEIKLWSTANFDIENSIPYVKEAFAARKWAFVADYIRLYALYTDGGIYLDSDVKVMKPFDDFLDVSFFTSIECHQFQVEQDDVSSKIDAAGHRVCDEYISGIQLQAAIMGAEKGCGFVRDILSWYDGKHFSGDAGSLGTNVIAPQIYARVAEKYGFVYIDKDQNLDGGIHIFRSEIFAGNRREITPASYAVHYCENTWRKRSALDALTHYLKFAWYLLKSKFSGK